MSWLMLETNADVARVGIHHGEDDKAIDEYLDIESDRSQTSRCC